MNTSKKNAIIVSMLFLLLIYFVVANSPPTKPTIINASEINIGNYETMVEGRSYTFFLNSTDPDDDNLTYFKIFVSGDDYCNINSDNGTITCSPTDEPIISLNDNFWFYASDAEFSYGRYVEFNVTPVNDRPTFQSQLDDYHFYENQTMEYNFTVADEENSTGPFKIAINSSFMLQVFENTTLNGYDFVIRFINDRRANYSDVGINYVTVTACDPEDAALCVNDTFMLNITSINHAPVLETIPNATGTQNQRFTLVVNASDLDADALNFSISADCGLDVWNITTTETYHLNASALINLTLNNDHLICANLTINVDDTKQTTSQRVYLELANANDAPSIHIQSRDPRNFLYNTKINNLTAYTGIRFTYKINATDPDSMINSSEIWTYSDNSSLCGGNCPTLTMNSTSGVITFMPNSSSNHYYKITVTDAGRKTDTEILNITIYENNPPYFIEVPVNQTAYEDTLFTYLLNASEPDSIFDSFKDNSSLFDIITDGMSGLINFTPDCSLTGNYSIKITLNDTFGGENSSNFVLEIQMTPDAPILPTVYNRTILEGQQYYLNIYDSTSDADMACGQTDSKTFTSRFFGSRTLFNISGSGIIDYTPNESSGGEYMINITVKDLYGLKDSVIFNLTILNRTSAPIIQNITPHGRPMNTTFVGVSTLGHNFTYTNTTENTTIYFAHRTFDPESNHILYNWTLNGTWVNSSKNYTKYFGFNDSGNYTIVLFVYDNVSNIIAHEVNFTWFVTIVNKNRPPQLITDLPDVNVSVEHTYENYMTGGAGNIRFYDPDGNSMTYNNTPTTKVAIEYSGNTVTFTGVELGVETVIFTASDGINTTSSNNVTINVTEIEEITRTTVSSSSSKSSKSSKPYPVFEEVEVQKEIFLDILNPEPAVIYDNNTLWQRLLIVNSGNKTLRGIHLSASTNSSTAELTFSNSFLAELNQGDSENVDLMVKDYKLYNNYVITIHANVTSPFYKDKAVIYINALEKSKGDDTLTNTKITFAKDLLSSNPECIELNEYLKRAIEYSNNEKFEEAQELIDAVIQNCKNLVSKSKLRDESPLGWALKLGEIPYFRQVAIAFTAIMLISIVITIRLKKINEDNEAL